MQGDGATGQGTSDVVTIDLSGSFTVPDGPPFLRKKIRELTAAGHKNVVINLQDLIYLDSSGIGELVSACTTLRNAGGDLKLVNAQGRVLNLLRMTRLSSIFDIVS